jgi:hypothetical protein
VGPSVPCSYGIGDHTRMSRWMVLVTAVTMSGSLLLAGCGDQVAPFSEPGHSASAAVAPPSDCQIAGRSVQWSGYMSQPVLTHVTVHRVSQAGSSAPGKTVLDTTFTPSVNGLSVPEAWLPALAKSLAAHTGDRIHSEAAILDEEGYGLSNGGPADPRILDRIFYQGVRRVSAKFSVECGSRLQGTFEAWTAKASGGLSCAQLNAPVEPFQRLARAYCPETPEPLPPSVADPESAEPIG